MKKPSAKIMAALNVRIAELMGWRSEPDDFYLDRRAWVWNGDRSTRCATPDLGDFTGSLDAIYGARVALLIDDRDKDMYCLKLKDRGAQRSWQTEWSLASSEAWQQCIALDRTLSTEPIL